MRKYLLLLACSLLAQWSAAQLKAYKQANGVSIQATSVLTVNTAVTLPGTAISQTNLLTTNCFTL